MTEARAALETPVLFPAAMWDADAAFERLQPSIGEQIHVVEGLRATVDDMRGILDVLQEGVGSARLGQMIAESGLNI